MCINQLNTITAKNTIKIQFTHFSALHNFTYLFVTPHDLPSISKTMALPIKQCPATCTLHLHLTSRHPDRCIHMSLNILIAPETPFHSAKFQSYIPFQSKVILTHVNSTHTPVGQKHTPETSHICYHKYTPLPKNID